MLIFGMVEAVGDPHLACSAWTAVSEMASAAGVVSSAGSFAKRGKQRGPRKGLRGPWNILEPTLWLCQNSYWKWLSIVDFPIKNGGSFHSYVNVYQRVEHLELG